MSTIPAVCQDCGRVFESRVFSSVEGSVALNLSGNTESCPYCEGTAEISDGIYELTDEVTRLISGPESSVDAIQRLAQIFREAQKEDLDRSDIEARISEAAPQFSGLADWLPESKSARYTLLTVLISLLGLVAEQWQSYQNRQVERKQNELLQEAIERAEECNSEEDIDQQVKIIIDSETTEQDSSQADAENRDEHNAGDTDR